MDNLHRLTTGQKLAEIRRLYFTTTRGTIQRDLERALDLLKSIASEADRERATVYMEGMAHMRRDWGGSQRQKEEGKRQKEEGKRQDVRSKSEVRKLEVRQSQRPDS